MKAVEHIHTVLPEEVMAYLDGELSTERAAAVHAHVVQCATCHGVASDLRQVSREMTSWEVEDPPETLAALERRAQIVAQPSVAWWRTAYVWQFAGISSVIVVFAGVWLASFRVQLPRSQTVDLPMSSRDSVRATVAAQPEALATGGRGGAARRIVAEAREVQPAPSAHTQATSVAEALRAPKIIRTANLTIVAKDFDAVRPAIDRMLRDVGGFVGQIQASDAGSADRSVRATLRVPAPRLDEAVRVLRTLGRVVDESQSGDDVTEQVQDIEARLGNSRNTEKRLNDVLRNRTGDVADVLQVEREIARVREEIERLDAERLNLERRVSYATVTLQVAEQRQATLDLGPLPVSTRLRNALVDGVRDAYESGVDVVLWALRVAPLLLLWTTGLWLPARAILRTIRARAA